MWRENSSRDGYPDNWTRSCDTCQAAACTLYCHNDSAYLCNRCDECIHSTNSVQHERVWVCTVCENAPAALFCQADAAFLCINCDVEVHTANPLARRHNRMLIPPLSSVDCASSTCDPEEMQGPAVETENQITACKSNEEVEQDETDSWLLLDLDNNDKLTNNGFTYVTDEAEEYLDLSEFNSCKEYQSQDLNDQQQLSSSYQVDNNSDSVVPVQSSEVNKQQQKQQENICNSEDSETSKVASSGATCSQRVTVPFVNAGFLVKATSDISNSRPAIQTGSNYLIPQPLLPMPLQFTPTNREARVLRYREKRKARTFQKKIRYASRKANAETRPRVKGRFVRKTDAEFEEDQMTGTEDYGYGIVPSY